MCYFICVTPEEISKVIKDRRTELGISQRKMAEMTGLSKYEIILVETNRKSPTLRTLEILCEALRMDISITA